MIRPELGRMEAEAFVEWAMTEPARYELDDGDVWAMAAERVGHSRIKTRLARLFDDEITRLKLAAEVFVDSMAVRVDESTVYEPDVMVRTGPPLDDDDVLVLDPVIVVEVSSPSSQALDAGSKLAGYFKLDSLRHYVIVRPKTRTILHYERQTDGAILTHIIRDGALALDPPGLQIANVFAA